MAAFSEIVFMGVVLFTSGIRLSRINAESWTYWLGRSGNCGNAAMAPGCEFSCHSGTPSSCVAKDEDCASAICAYVWCDLFSGVLGEFDLESIAAAPDGMDSIHFRTWRP